MKIKAIFFDLDGTLHDYKDSSAIAMDRVFELITSGYGIEADELKGEYNKLLKKAEEHAFLDGRTSTEYRRERFENLLRRFEIRDADLVEKLLEAYGTHLERNMEPLPGIDELLSRLNTEYELYITTEGPEDAQKRAVDILGISQYFRDVFISGEAKKIKEDGGLFRYAVKKTDYRPDEIVSVGDSYRKDVLGALSAGLKTVWFNKENRELGPDDPHPHFQIGELGELEGALSKLQQPGKGY